MSEKTIDNRLTVLETKIDHFTDLFNEVKKKLDELTGDRSTIQRLETRLAVLEVRFSVVQWAGGLVGSGVVGYIILAIMKIV